MVTDDPVWKLSKIIVNLDGLPTDVRDGGLVDCFRIVDKATKLGSELLSLNENMPGQAKFETIWIKEKSELVYRECFPVYPNLLVGCAWNSFGTY